MVDVNETVMQATISANRLIRFRRKLTAGKIYFVSDFDVAWSLLDRCHQSFKAFVQDCEVQCVEGDTSWCFCFSKEGFRWRLESVFEISSIQFVQLLMSCTVCRLPYAADIEGGTNLRRWPEKMSDDELDIVRNAGVVLLQREIPDSINIQVAKSCEESWSSLTWDDWIRQSLMSYWIQSTS
ncbi:hypothetical protein Rs2_15755 [Raphanus sativus]|nr:hypothetical protein Rs2_15755 [Raphanus sativus]